jgi:hypothetical protein
MRLTRILVITFFFLSTSAFSDRLKQECDKITAKVEVVDTSNGLRNGRVKIEIVKGSQIGLKYIFCLESGKVLNEKQFGTNSLDGLDRGGYFCLVSNSDCTQKINFTIK